MFEATSTADVINALGFLQYGDQLPAQGRVQVGLLFARPGLTLAKEQVLPNLEYFHRRSAEKMHFFCAGYAFGSAEYASEYWTSKDYRVLSSQSIDQLDRDRDVWQFSERRFVEFVQELEETTTWRYRGETELIILQALINKRHVRLDYMSAVALSLDRLVEEKVIRSVPEFLENVIRDAKPIHNVHLAWSTSDVEGWRYGSRKLGDWLLSLLPGRTEGVAALSELGIRDISKSNVGDSAKC